MRIFCYLLTAIVLMALGDVARAERRDASDRATAMDRNMDRNDIRQRRLETKSLKEFGTDSNFQQQQKKKPNRNVIDSQPR